ncbi:MAG TPA: outer membrane protein assembly factor BamE [Tepidisphaeraceae bacterium]|jgi:outer membrane protein assembly factor BamE (lipoprotein component of BamABCDE complex)
MNRFRLALSLTAFWLCMTALAGCISETTSQGVANLWRGESPPVFRQGTSTQQDVLTALGPPSQVISLGNQTVFYYLLQQTRSQSAVLIVYNQIQTNIVYDRVIFFFDAKGRLTDFATSNEKIERPKK